MVDAFDAAFRWVLEAEGPDSNDPDDPGGLTRFGIAQRKHPELDVRTVTEEGARHHYRRHYWDPIQGDQLPRVTALVVFDGAVNHGRRRSVLWLQEALGVQTDGLVGPKTVASAHTLGLAIVPRYLRLRARAYVDLAASKPVFLKYLNGWLERLFRVQQRALQEDL